MKPVPPNTVMEPAMTHLLLHSPEIDRAMHHRARSALFKGHRVLLYCIDFCSDEYLKCEARITIYFEVQEVRRAALFGPLASLKPPKSLIGPTCRSASGCGR